MWRAALTHAALIGLGLLMLTPLLWMIGTSLKPDGAEFEKAWGTATEEILTGKKSVKQSMDDLAKLADGLSA